MKFGRVAGTAVSESAADSGHYLVDDVLDTGSVVIQVHARRRDSLFEQLLTCAFEASFASRPVPHGSIRRHAEILLVETAIRITLNVSGRFVSTSQPRSEHHTARTSRQGQGDVTRITDSPVGPNRFTEFVCGFGTLENSRELGATDSGHHSRRTHSARSDSDFDHIGAGFDQIDRTLPRDHIAGDNDGLGGSSPNSAHGVDHAILVTMGRVDHQNVDTHVAESSSLLGWFAVHPDGYGGEKFTSAIDGWTVQVRPKSTLARDATDEAPLCVDHWGRGQPMP
jgi:hypothetical protein